MFSYWDSSQHKFTKVAKNAALHVIELSNQKFLSIKDQKILLIHYLKMIKSLGINLKLPHVVVTTAMIYMRKFYVSNSMGICDPLILVPTCLLLASKIEECPVYADFILSKWNECEHYTVTDILNLEKYLMKELQFHLLTFHPFESLEKFLRHMKEMKVYTLDSEKEKLTQFSWNIVNDCYYSELILQYPPYTIALASIYMASILFEDEFEEGFQERLEEWFSEQSVHMNMIGEIVDKLYDLYKILKTFDSDYAVPLLELRSWFSSSRKPSPLPSHVSPPMMHSRGYGRGPVSSHPQRR